MWTKYCSRENSRNSCSVKEMSPTNSITLFFLATLRYNKDLYPQVVSYGGCGTVVFIFCWTNRDNNKKVVNLLLIRIILTGMSDI